MKKRLVSLLVALTSLTLVGCGSSGYLSEDSKSVNAMASNDAYYDEYDYSYDNGYAYEDSYEMVTEESMAAYDSSSTTVSTTENAATTNRKLIKNVNLSVETKEYDSLVNNLTNDINAMGGYIEYMDVRNGSYNSSRTSRYASITARIPAAKLYDFVNSVGEVANITNKTESVQDVTLSYVDMESHKNMLIAERDRLIEMMEDCETIEEMIYVEDRLAEIRYQIDSMESQLRTYDNQVDYSTVQISIQEVVTYTPPVVEEQSDWERLTEGFVESLVGVGTGIKEFTIELIIALPYLIVFFGSIAIALVILFQLLRLIPGYREWNDEVRAKRKARKAAKKAAKKAKKAGLPVAEATPDDKAVTAEATTDDKGVAAEATDNVAKTADDNKTNN